MSRVGRAQERGETQGVMRLLADADTEEILGAAFLGIEADEIVHAVIDLMYAKAPYTLLQQAMHIHPTVAEFIPELAKAMKPLV